MPAEVFTERPGDFENFSGAQAPDPFHFSLSKGLNRVLYFLSFTNIHMDRSTGSQYCPFIVLDQGMKGEEEGTELRPVNYDASAGHCLIWRTIITRN